MNKYIRDPIIAKEKYENLYKISHKLSKDKYVEFVENSDYFIWLEDTIEVKQSIKNINLIPQSFRDGFLKAHNKTHACAQFNNYKKFYELTLNFNEEFGIISSTFQKKITSKDLHVLFDMSKYLDALLLNGVDKDVIDETTIDTIS